MRTSAQQRNTIRKAIATAMLGMLLLPVASTGKDDRSASDVCLRVDAGPRARTATDIAARVLDGRAEIVGSGNACDDGQVVTVGVPRDDLTDIRERSWNKLEFRDGGRTLEVHYHDGVPSCVGLHRVEVTTSDGGLEVRVFTGMLPAGKGTVCPKPLGPWVTTVDLGDRLAFGSNGEAEEAEAARIRLARDAHMAAVHDLAEALPGHFEFSTDTQGREDFRLTPRGRRHALQFVDNPEATDDTLVGVLLRQDGPAPTDPAAP